MQGLIGKKIGMTSIFDATGKNLACTVVEVGPCVVTQVKTSKTDGYDAVQLAFGEKKEKNTTKPLQGHFKKAETTPKKEVMEFKDFDGRTFSLGEILTIESVFVVGDKVEVVGLSKGKGFQGVVKRHSFSGVNDQTHGQHNRQRAPGSIGASSFPSKVFKGMRMAGRDGGSQVKIKGLKILKVFPERNLLVISGAIPGHKGSTIVVNKKN